jgi:hypothetical protein
MTFGSRFPPCGDRERRPALAHRGRDHDLFSRPGLARSRAGAGGPPAAASASPHRRTEHLLYALRRDRLPAHRPLATGHVLNHDPGRWPDGLTHDVGETVTADDLAAAIVEELDRPLDYLPVETDGAQRAAELIHELV